MRHTLAILVVNRFGELARIVGLFSARGYNIESLTVAETLEPEISRMTLVTSGDNGTVEKIVKQIDKQIRVLSVVDLTMLDHIEREMVLVHVKAQPGNARAEVMQLASIFGAKVVDVSEGAVTLEVVGERERVDALLGLLQPFGIQEMARTGVLAIGRSSASAAGSKQSQLAVGEKM